METIKQCLGIDVAAKEVQVCFMVKLENGQRKIKGTRKFSNTRKGINELEQWLQKRLCLELDFSVVMEATGVYYEALAYDLDACGYCIHVLLPNKAKNYFKFLNLKSKTDKIEAKALAQMGLDEHLPIWKAATPQMYEIKRLCRERGMLNEEKTLVNNRLHAEKACRFTNRSIVRRYHQRLKLVEKQLKEVEAQLEQVTDLDEQLRERITNVCTIKGVGFITAITIIAETNGFELVTHRSQLVSYAGYDVIERQSGSSVMGKSRISKRGNKHIRRALYFPAISVAKYLPEFKDLYSRVHERTTYKMKGYVAIQRKLLVLIYTLYKNNQPYDPKYAQQQADKQSCRQDITPAYAG